MDGHPILHCRARESLAAHAAPALRASLPLWITGLSLPRTYSCLRSPRHFALAFTAENTCAKLHFSFAYYLLTLHRTLSGSVPLQGSKAPFQPFSMTPRKRPAESSPRGNSPPGKQTKIPESRNDASRKVWLFLSARHHMWIPAFSFLELLH